MKIKLIITSFLLASSFAAFAIGPEYEKGKGLTHAVSCTPPTLRAPNAEGVQLPLTNDELDYGTVYLYEGGDLFTQGTLLDTQQTNIFCNWDLPVDNYPSGQMHLFATVTDTEARTSEVSIQGAPFYSFVILMPPNAPIMTTQ